MIGTFAARPAATADSPNGVARVPWPIARLGEVLTHRKEFLRIDDTREYLRCRVQLHAKGVVVRDRVVGAIIKTKEQQVCRAGEFLVAEIDAKVGGFGVVPIGLDGAIVSSHYFLFTVNEECLDRRFLDYYSKTPAFRDQVQAQGSTNYAAIRPHHVLDYTIPLPPLPEQHRIVAKLDQVSEKVGQARVVRDAISRQAGLLLGSTVRDIFTRKEGAGWINCTLGDLLRSACYGTSEKTHAEPAGVPVLRMGNIQEGSLTTRDLRYLEIADRDRGKWILQRGDLLVNRTNSAELVGKSAVFDLDGEWAFASYLIRLRLDDRADPWLICRFLNSPSGRTYMLKTKKQMTGQANVNLQTLRDLPLSLPPLDQQRRIAHYLNRMEAKSRAAVVVAGRVVTELDALVPAILDRAFTGRL